MTEFFDSWAAVALAGVLCGLAGLLVPALIRRIPEPDPVEAPAEVTAEPPPGSTGSVRPEQEPKETYAEVAALPGLVWRAALASAVSGAAIAWAVDDPWPLLFLLPLVPVGVALAVVDWRTMLLPTKVIAPTYLGLVALVLVTFAITHDTADLVRAVLGWAIAGGVFFVLWFVYPRGLGYGDVRLSGLLGIALGYLGWGPLLVGVYGGFLLGGVGGGLLSVLRIVERKAFPFGPFMLVGALLGVLVGPAVLTSLAAR